MWTSSKNTPFACFPSKLSRVFHEQARKRIVLQWGEAKHPDCRGFKHSEIQEIDFAKLDYQEHLKPLKSKIMKKARRLRSEIQRKNVQGEKMNS